MGPAGRRQAGDEFDQGAQFGNARAGGLEMTCGGFAEGRLHAAPGLVESGQRLFDGAEPAQGFGKGAQRGVGGDALAQCLGAVAQGVERVDLLQLAQCAGADLRGERGVALLDVFEQVEIAVALCQHVAMQHGQLREQFVALQRRDGAELGGEGVELGEGVAKGCGRAGEAPGNRGVLFLQLREGGLPVVESGAYALEVEQLQLSIAHAVPRVLVQACIGAELLDQGLMHAAVGNALVGVAALGIGVPAAAVVPFGVQGFGVDRAGLPRWVQPGSEAVAGGGRKDLVRGLAGVLPRLVDPLRVALEGVLEFFVARDVGSDLFGRAIVAVLAQALFDFVEHLAFLGLVAVQLEAEFAEPSAVEPAAHDLERGELLGDEQHLLALRDGGRDEVGDGL